jgi:DNA replication licensing factor MCM2
MYAKEKFQPKLQQLDQEKLARLYADLRRESLATGSFPITVRHLESMIRMAEASAKMNLREYVRSDDIDLAIQVTVGSFVNAQKISIKKTLERVSDTQVSKDVRDTNGCDTKGFRKYVHKATDNEELLAFLLGQLIKEKVQIALHQTGREPEKITVPYNQLEARVSGNALTFGMEP